MKYSTYTKYAKRKINSLPIVYFYSQKQFEDAMKKLGLNTSQTNLIYRDSVGGGIYKRKDKQLKDYVYNEVSLLLQNLLNTDDDFFVDAVKTELANCDVCFGGKISDVLSILNLSWADMNTNERTERLFLKACELYDKELGLI